MSGAGLQSSSAVGSVRGGVDRLWIRHLPRRWPGSGRRWLDLAATEWSTLRVNRAEPEMPHGQRPDDCFLQQDGKLITAWPTKLAFAPRLAQKVLDLLGPTTQAPDSAVMGVDLDLPHPAVARFPWEEVEQWY